MKIDLKKISERMAALKRRIVGQFIPVQTLGYLKPRGWLPAGTEFVPLVLLLKEGDAVTVDGKPMAYLCRVEDSEDLHWVTDGGFSHKVKAEQIKKPASV